MPGASSSAAAAGRATVIAWLISGNRSGNTASITTPWISSMRPTLRLAVSPPDLPGGSIVVVVAIGLFSLLFVCSSRFRAGVSSGVSGGFACLAACRAGCLAGLLCAREGGFGGCGGGWGWVWGAGGGLRCLRRVLGAGGGLGLCINFLQPANLCIYSGNTMVHQVRNLYNFLPPRALKYRHNPQPVSAQTLCAGDNLHDLLGDLGLPRAVHLERQIGDDLPGVLRRVAHRGHLRPEEPRRGLDQRAVDRGLDIVWHELGENLFRVGLVLDQRFRAVIGVARRR